MEGGLDNGAYGGLFLNIMSDLRSSSPVWEDFCSKATKLHTSLKATLTAITAFLDAFQKVADMATGSKGATKEIGTSLTRLCMRHKAIEGKLKKFTGTILESLVNPLQECMEDWKKSVVQLDKERTKEYKKSKAEIKKCASDTVRLQKKVKKGKSDMQSRLDSAMQDVNDKYILLEEQEKHAVRTAMIEERGRYCHFVTCLKPFVEEEVGLLTEVTHLGEIMESLCLQADSPKALPPSSEQVILDLKGNESGPWNLQQRRSLRVPKVFVGSKTPPSSPSSIGSRKSSMCSISSMASSSSGSAQSHSPCHNKNIQQQHAQLLGSGLRLTSVSSQDSGFTSQDTLFLRPTTPSSLNIQMQNSDNISQGTDTPEIDSTPSTPSESYPNTPSATSTWTNWPNPPVSSSKTESGRPHTISSAYEKSHHARPALTSNLFEPPQSSTLPKALDRESGQHEPTVIKRDRPHSTMSVPYSRPAAAINKMQPVLPPLGPKPKSRAVAPPKVPPIGEQPVYANLSELNIVPNEIIDLDKTPTNKQPPCSDPDESSEDTPVMDPSQYRNPLRHPGTTKKYDGLDLSEAIRDLDNYTAALHGDFSPEHRRSQMQKNSMELANAIKQLEASTAALDASYSTEPQVSHQASQQSLQCSSGYGTMNSTPTGSMEDTLASGDFVDSGAPRERPDHEKYFTIPRNSALTSMYRAQFKRPASTAGIPMSAQGGNGGALARRSSLNQPKPPPPVRRSSSIVSSSNPAVLQKYRNSPPRQMGPPANPPPQVYQAQQMNENRPNHQRSLSASGGSLSGSEPAYAELQEIQQMIHGRNQQRQDGQYGGSHGHQGSAPTTPQYALPVTNPGPNTNVINSLNAKFSAMSSRDTVVVDSSQYSSQTQVQNAAVYPGHVQTNSASGSGGGRGGEDFPDLPPPPSVDELIEMEKIYNVPNVQPQSQNFNTQTQNNVQLRQVPQSPSVVAPPVGGVRQSLISEMMAGNKFRKLSKSEEGSEC